MVSIYKVLDKNDRFGNSIVKQVINVETYREALEKIEDLKSKNKNPNITYIAGDIYK